MTQSFPIGKLFLQTKFNLFKMKNILFLFIIFTFFNTNAQTQFKNNSIKIFIDKSFKIIEENSINKNEKNILTLKNEMYEKTSNLSNLDELPPFYIAVFKALNDHHGGLKYKEKTFGWSIPLQGKNESVKNLIFKNKKVHSEIINKKYGYIRIPGNSDFSFQKVDSISTDIISQINSINSNTIKGWIIDLRLNTGGNMYPILLGLKDFLGNNIVFGGFKNANNENTGTWEIKDNRLIIDGNILQNKTALKYQIPENIPIVILSSFYTASAGEMTTIAFKGRDKAFIVGEPTANYTTAVQGFEINNFSGINLSTDYVFDRNSNIYKSFVNPDFEIINGDDFNNLAKDKKIIKAIDLLKRNQ